MLILSLTTLGRKPEWLSKPPGSAASTVNIKRLLRGAKLNTVCEEARCPNISECFSRGTATFMILGDVCTRGCRFCAVKTGVPVFSPKDFQSEAEEVTRAVIELNLKHVVITSVARDDLEDGGASGFVYTISTLRKRVPSVTIEVLIPDFRGNMKPLFDVLQSSPDILNHNLETVPRLYRRVRPGASYHRSLQLLKEAKINYPKIRTKTGIMLGLGEKAEEVKTVLDDARDHGVEIFTAGQYLQPTSKHLPVVEYITPETFERLKQYGESKGFTHCFMGPLVRSSYHAEEFI